MKIRNNTIFVIEKEEGLEMLKTWEKTSMEGMKLYGNMNSFLKVGNKLRELKEVNCTFVRIDIEDYYNFSINLITNINLINKG